MLPLSVSECDLILLEAGGDLQQVEAGLGPRSDEAGRGGGAPVSLPGKGWIIKYWRGPKLKKKIVFIFR